MALTTPLSSSTIATRSETKVSNNSGPIAGPCATPRRFLCVSAEVKVVAKLSGHASAIRDLAWSPFEGNKLVSASEDGVAQVWDVVSKSVIATFVGHNLECVTSVLWSPLDPDLIITGAKDNTIRIWRVSENPPLAEVGK